MVSLGILGWRGEIVVQQPTMPLSSCIMNAIIDSGEGKERSQERTRGTGEGYFRTKRDLLFRQTLFDVCVQRFQYFFGSPLRNVTARFSLASKPYMVDYLAFSENSRFSYDETSRFLVAWDPSLGATVPPSDA